MAQQTAVEWFEKNYHELLVEASINNMHVVLFDKKRGELFQQAKAMEKEHIIDFAAEVSYGIGATKEEMKKVAEQYYNEIYNK